jgi:hypothetical protein
MFLLCELTHCLARRTKDISPAVDISTVNKHRAARTALLCESPMASIERPADRGTRRHPRFKLDVEVKIHSKTEGLVVGRSAEISEAGMSVMLVPELTVGEVVKLDFELPFGPANVLAVVRSRNAFRYGFQFVQPHAAEHRIRQSCRILPPSG